MSKRTTAAAFALLTLLIAATAYAQEEPLPAPPPDQPVQPPPPPPPPPPRYPPPYPVQQPPPPGYGYPYQPYPGYPMAFIKLEPNRTAQRVSIYAELLGKTFLWGVGCDVNITSWLGLGVSFSYYRVLNWQLGLVAPYVSFYPVGSQKHAMLIQAGPEIAFLGEGDFAIWNDKGTSVFGQVSVGYEYRNHFLVRPALSFFFNNYGFLPWVGVSLGGSI